MHTSTLHFHGAAGMVTGSNFLLETGTQKLLIDCGLMQGPAEDRNDEPFAYKPSEITALFVTHAHLDHIGRIPRLVKEGFNGPIYSTAATRALAEPILQDAQHIMAERAERQQHEVLYDEEDIQKAMRLWKPLEYLAPIPLADDVSVEFLDAGHILGSAMVRFLRDGKSVVFTGDLGGGNSPLLPPTYALTNATYLIMEGTYGDKLRPEDKNRREHLEDIIENAVSRGGTLLIPAFSTERTQDLLFELRTLMTEHRVPSVPVFLDSPLAEKVTAIFMHYPQYLSQEMKGRIEGGEQLFTFPELKFIKDVRDSHKIAEHKGAKIILAGSGMSSGGRVLAHERTYLPDEHSTLLIVGYQAAGTMGRRILEGAKTLTYKDEHIPVRAHIETLYGYSAHGDSEMLLEFANQAAEDGEEIFVVHSEPAAATFLSQRIRDYLGIKATVPKEGQSAVLQF